jgi:hypothetical protein
VTAAQVVGRAPRDGAHRRDVLARDRALLLDARATSSRAGGQIMDREPAAAARGRRPNAAYTAIAQGYVLDSKGCRGRDSMNLATLLYLPADAHRSGSSPAARDPPGKAGTRRGP